MTEHPHRDDAAGFMSQPSEELGRMARLLQLQIGMWRFCAQRLRQNNVMAMSAALSFRTIFALIPTLVLVFLAARGVGALSDSQKSLRTLLERSGLGQITALQDADDVSSRPTGVESPTSEFVGPRFVSVADEIEHMVARVENKLTFQRLGPIGGALFIWSAITLISTIESSLNRVFGAARSRSTSRRVLLYWSVMTIGPLAVSAASHLGEKAVETFSQMAGLSWLLVILGWVGPIVVGVVVLAAVYRYLPNTRVDFRAALGGALIAVLLWLLAKWGFSQYVQRLVVRGNLYGVLGVFPLFMMWLNFSWMIFLFGAELTHTAANIGRLHTVTKDQTNVISPADALTVALAVIGRFRSGGGPVEFDPVAGEVDLSGEATQWLLDALCARGVLCTTGDADDEPRYVPARPAESIRVVDVLDYFEKRELISGPHRSSTKLAAMIGSVTARMQKPIADLTIADLLAEHAPRPKSAS